MYIINSTPYSYKFHNYKLLSYEHWDTDTLRAHRHVVLYLSSVTVLYGLNIKLYGTVHM